MSESTSEDPLIAILNNNDHIEVVVNELFSTEEIEKYAADEATNGNPTDVIIDNCNSITGNGMLSGQSQDVSTQRGRGIDDMDLLAASPPVEYQANYPIKRFGRRWRRQEVQGVCCLSIETMCLVCLTILSLHGLGYMEEVVPQLPPQQGYIPYSFSAKILREFFTYEETPSSYVSCFNNLATPGRANEETLEETFLEQPENNRGEVSIFDTLTSRGDEGVQLERRFYFRSPRCKNSNSGRYASEWLGRYFFVHILSILTIFTSTFFFLSISVRRRQGLQVMLLLPPFLSFFISIFQQIPVTFQYSYVGFLLKEDLRSAMSLSSQHHYKPVPLLDQTQINMQCCGSEGAESWELLANFNGSYPGSCCNSTVYNCTGERYISKNETWSEGCFQKEFERTRKYEKWGLVLLGLKVLAEIGLFCTLSDLTRFEYPPPEAVENSRCEVKEYQIKSKGVVRIKGVTKDGRVVAETKGLFPWRLIPTKTELVNGATLTLRTNVNHTKGSVEVVKRMNNDNFVAEDVLIDMRKRNSGIYIFTLR